MLTLNITIEGNTTEQLLEGLEAIKNQIIHDQVSCLNYSHDETVFFSFNIENGRAEYLEELAAENVPLYQISLSGSKQIPYYIIERTDGSELIDMFFDTIEQAKAYANKKELSLKGNESI